jgi:hypothetical protein
MNQIISILDGYAYRTRVRDIYVERVVRPRSGASADEQNRAGALPAAEICLFALAELIGEAPCLAGPAITLADLPARALCGPRRRRAMSHTQRQQSEPGRSGNIHRDIVGTGRVAVVSIAVRTVALMVDAVSGTHPVFGPVKNEG